MIVLTYPGAHRKAYDLINLLMARGEAFSVVAVEMQYLKTHEPLILHRPAPPPVATEGLCAAHGIQMVTLGDYGGFDPAGDTVLIAGASVIPRKTVERGEFINSHPGYLPYVRGLDALKWAIHQGMPIGVTTHIVGEEPDAGELIQRKLIDIDAFDTFGSLAQRQYELEVLMLADAPHVERSGERVEAEGVLHKRMPHKLEARLYDRFEERVRRRGAA